MISGKNMRRPAWTQLREMLWPGEVVVVPRIDRMAGNLAEGIRTVQYLHDQGIHIRALPKGLDTGDDNPTSKLMLHMLLSLAEWERESIRGRIRGRRGPRRGRGQDRGQAPGAGLREDTSREGLPGRRQVGQRGRQNLRCGPGYYQGRQGLDLHEADRRSQC